MAGEYNRQRRDPFAPMANDPLAPFGMTPEQFQLDPRVAAAMGVAPPQFGGQSFFPQQEPVDEGFTPQWGMPDNDPMFGYGPDPSSIDPTFGRFGGDDGDGFGPVPLGGQQKRKGPTLSPDLAEHDNLPDEGGPDDHPGYLDYLAQANPWGDIGVKAAILARSFTNPEQATQWMIRMKENEAQRQLQVYQAEQAQTAKKELEKAKSAQDKEKRDEDQFNREKVKLEAAIRGANYNPDETLAEIGPVTKENLPEWQRRVQVAKSEKDAKDRTDKENKETLKTKTQILDGIGRGSDPPVSSYPEKIRKDPDFLAAVETARANRKRTTELDERAKKALADLREAHAKSEDPKTKNDLQIAMKKIDLAMKRQLARESSRRSAQSANLFLMEDPVAALNEFTGALDRDILESEIEVDQAIGEAEAIAAGKPKPTPVEPPTGPPKGLKATPGGERFKGIKQGGTPAPKSAAPAAEAAPEPAKPGAEQIRGFAYLIQANPGKKDYYVREWKRQFPGAPVPGE